MLFGIAASHPLLFEGPEITSEIQGDPMKNLKDLWQRSPDLLDGIGGEQLAGSGFECENPDVEYVSAEPGQEREE
jgi:hypothetical protein